MATTTSDIEKMIRHWLSTPPNGYFGSPYGADLNSLLLKKDSQEVAEKFLAKMKTDLPILSMLPSNTFELLLSDKGYETAILFLRVGQISINLDNLNKVRSNAI